MHQRRFTAAANAGDDLNFIKFQLANSHFVVQALVWLWIGAIIPVLVLFN